MRGNDKGRKDTFGRKEDVISMLSVEESNLQGGSKVQRWQEANRKWRQITGFARNWKD